MVCHDLSGNRLDRYQNAAIFKKIGAFLLTRAGLTERSRDSSARNS
jgi:hypothetical protein